MSVFRNSTCCAPCVVGLLIVSLTFTGCPALLSQLANGGASTGESQNGQPLTVFQDTSPDSPFSYIAVNQETGDRMGLLAQKDEAGNPITPQGAVLAQPTGKGWVVTLGEDGLPAQLIAVNSSKIYFSNWTADTVDVTIPSTSGTKSATVQTVSMDTKTESRLAQLRELTAGKAAMSDAAAGLTITVAIFSLMAGIVGAVSDTPEVGIPTLLAAVASFVNLVLDSPSGWLTAGTIICLSATIVMFAMSSQDSENIVSVSFSAMALIMALIAAFLPPNPTETPQMLTPGNGSFAEGTDVTLDWSAVEDATGYECQLAQTSDFEEPQTSGVTPNSSFTWSALPNDSSIWYWRVRAQSDAGWSDYSTPRSFCNGSLYGKWSVTPHGCSGDFCADQPDVMTIDSDGTWSMHDHSGRTVTGTYTVGGTGILHLTCEDNQVIDGVQANVFYEGRLYPYNGTLSGYLDVEACAKISEDDEECYYGGTDLDCTRDAKSLSAAIEDATQPGTSLWSTATSRLLTVAVP